MALLFEIYLAPPEPSTQGHVEGLSPSAVLVPRSAGLLQKALSHLPEEVAGLLRFRWGEGAVVQCIARVIVVRRGIVWGPAGNVDSALIVGRP